MEDPTYFPEDANELMHWKITDAYSQKRFADVIATFGLPLEMLGFPQGLPPINVVENLGHGGSLASDMSDEPSTMTAIEELDMSLPYFIEYTIDVNNSEVMTYQSQFPASGYNSNRPFLMWIAAFYGMLFIIGTCGNVAILAIVHYVKNDNSKARMRHNTTLTYLSVLCITDFLSMMPLPMTILDQILGFWIFGSYACKLSRLLEHISKIFSNFILVAFSVDRYLAVCHPLKTNLRTPSKVFLILGVVFLISCSLISPMIYNAKSKSYAMDNMYSNQTNTLHVMYCNKCVDDMPPQTFIIFIVLTFILAYFVPFCLLIYFYYAMLARLFKQARMTKGLRGKRIDDKIPVFRIACYTLLICFFHFLCWTPYWMSVVYQLIREFYTVEPQELEAQVIYIMYLVHALPYVNSASNFVLYGLLNRQEVHGMVDFTPYSPDFTHECNEAPSHEPPRGILQQHRGGRRGHGTIVSSIPPTLKFTECTETKENGGHHSTMDSMAARTPPSTPCRPDVNGKGKSKDQSNGKANGEKSPLIRCSSEKNGSVTIASRTPISEYKLDDGESIMI